MIPFNSRIRRDLSNTAAIPAYTVPESDANASISIATISVSVMQQVGTGYATDYLSCSPSHSATQELREGNLKMLENDDLVVCIFLTEGKSCQRVFDERVILPAKQPRSLNSRSLMVPSGLPEITL
jgi:hypothetical protein